MQTGKIPEALVSAMPQRVPAASSENARATMRANKGKDTSPELTVRRLLRQAGHTGYRLQWPIRDDGGKLVTRVDVCFPGRKIAIFVHGCFWHRCPKCMLPLPKRNQEFWVAKFEDNVARDRLNEQKLRRMGWQVFTIWECDSKDKNLRLIAEMM